MEKIHTETLEKQYQDYKSWLKQRHLDDGTWVLNWDIKEERFADFGIGDALFYTGIYLTALALEGNETEFSQIIEKLNQYKYLPGMYPRYPETYDTSKDPYHQVILSLVIAEQKFPANQLVKETLREIFESLAENGYRVRENPSICEGTGRNPDCNTSNGNLFELRPMKSAMEGKTPALFYLAMLGLPGYTLFRKLFISGKYFNLFMVAAQYLVYNRYIQSGVGRWFLRTSVKWFASIEKRNPYYLMIRDILTNEKKHQAAVEAIMARFPVDNLPNDEEPLAHLDVLWQRNPDLWENTDPRIGYEYPGIDFMVMYRLYEQHYLSND